MGTEFSHKVYLFQGLPKSDKMELIIQKTVELGVSRYRHTGCHEKLCGKAG